MEELSPTQKATSSKKVTSTPVESSINQRPRRTIKHKFIKCNRDSPEKSADTSAEIDTKSEEVAGNVSIEPDDSSEKSIPPSTKPKAKLKKDQKTRSRRSNRQNQSNDASVDFDDSSLQMVEIIDDPSDDPNVSIQEIIETCALDAQEYRRMTMSSKEVCSESSKATSDESDSNGKTSTKRTKKACEKQISVGLIDCMKSKNMLKHLMEDESTVSDKRKMSSSPNQALEKDKVENRPPKEISPSIRTRRVTRLSSISPHLMLDAKIDSPKNSSLKNKMEAQQIAAQTTEASKPVEFRVKIEIEKCENSPLLEDSGKQSEVSSDSNKSLNKNVTISSLADSQTEKIMETKEKAEEESGTEDVKDLLDILGGENASENAGATTERNQDLVVSEMTADESSSTSISTETAEHSIAKLSAAEPADVELCFAEPDESSSAEPSPAEPSPDEPSSAEPSPAEPSPAESSPTEPSPAEPSPAEPSPAEPSPAESSPAESSPAEHSPAEPSPIGPTPAKNLSTDALHAEYLFAEPSPAGSSPPEPSPAETSTAELLPAEPLPAELLPAEPLPAEPSLAAPSPAEPSPAEPSPAEPSPTEPSPAEPSPTEPSPAEHSPAEHSPAEPAPAESSHTDPSPAEHVETSQETEGRLKNEEKTKDKVKAKKERKRKAERIGNRLKDDGAGKLSTVASKKEVTSSSEKKSRDSDQSKQILQAHVDEGAQKHESVGDVVKPEKIKKKKLSHSDKDKVSKSKRTSDSSRKSDGQSTHKVSSSKSLVKKNKEAKSTESKLKHTLAEQDQQMKKGHKRDNSSNRSEKEISTDQSKQIEQKTLNRSKSSSASQLFQSQNFQSSEKTRDSIGKSKVKSTTVKSKDPSSSKIPTDAVSTNRKNQQPTTSTNRTSGKSNRSGTDFILSECYLPKQVKHDDNLYSIEALKAAQAAQEEQVKADAEFARKAKEILAAKEEQAKAARAAARLARLEAEKAEKIAKAEADKAAKQAKAAAKASRQKHKETSNKSNDSPKIDSFGLFAGKNDSQEPQTSSPNVSTLRETSSQDCVSENVKNSPEFVQYQSLEHEISEIVTRSEEAALLADEEETNIRRSGRIKTITETKQRACGFGLVKDKDKFHNMYAGDISYSSMSDSQYMSDYNSSSNSNSMLDLSEIGKDMDVQPVAVKREKTAEELEAERLDVAEGLSLFKQIIDCEYRSERTISKETKKMTCDCFLTKSEIERGELGCGEDCLNRLIFIECGSRCAVGDRCTNKRFQKHQNSDCTIFKAGKKGFGMKAVSVIEAGEFIMEYVGEVLNTKQFDERRFKYSNDNIQHHYFMALRSDCVIDATTKGNISRFINHSCDPNAETQKWTVNGELRIGFFSTRTIQPDEEITFDYQFQRYGKEAQKCYCEAENCRGWIGEEPDSEDEAEEDYEDEEDEEEEEEEEVEEECEEEQEQIEEKDVTPTELTAADATKTADNLMKPLDVQVEETSETSKVDEKITVPGTPSPTKKVRKPKLEPKPKKFKIKKSEIMEDPDLDHEIANLMKTNLKNQAHTLRFSRLMVRAKMLAARSKLLDILRNGELACRRLFLDYHGLKLLYTWMCDPITSNVQRDWAFRLDILETLVFLPIPNKNMLQDSKVLAIVRKWANTKSVKENEKSPEDQSPSDSGSGTPEGRSPHVDEAKSVDSAKVETTEKIKCDIDPSEAIDSSKEVAVSSKHSVSINDSLKEVSKSLATAESDDKKNRDELQPKASEDCADDELMEQIHLITTTLLASWETLKEVFRIPKKLRIEQMKEHEQEANRSYRALGIAETEDSNKRYIDAPKDKEKERFKKEKRSRHRDPNDPDSALLKAERRRLFEAQVAQDTIDKRNYERQLEAIHIAKCKYFQLDPRVTSYRDVPFSVSPLTGQWYSKDNEMIPTPPSHAHIKPPQELPTNPDEYDLPPMDLPPQWKFAIDPRGKLYYYHVKIRIPQWDPPIKILPLREEQTPCVDDIKMELCDDSENDTKDDSLLHSNLSNDFDSDKDDDSEESSDAIDSSEDELMQRRQQLLNSFQSNQTDLDISANLAVEISAMATTSSMDDSADQSFNLDLSLMHSSGKKKNRDGLATERLISPRTDEERIQSKIEMQKYKANKEKLRRRRENAKLRTHGLSEPSRKLKKLTDGLPVVSQQDDEMDDTDEEEEANVSDLEAGVLDAKFVDELDGIKSDKVSNRPDNQKVRLDALRSNRKVPKRKRPEPEPVPHNSNEAAKRIKEKFCAEMSGVIVQHLGPYRRDDCRIGRITNNEDFKHLARKLTHFVMLKELKHCDNTVTVLEVSDSVRAKSKEFIRKYMAKFGEVYVKPENDPEYKEFCNT